MREVAFGINPHFKRQTRRKRRKHQAMVILINKAFLVALLEFKHYAMNAFFALLKITGRSPYAFSYIRRHHRNRDNLRMGMRERSARPLTVIMKNRNIAYAISSPNGA